MLCPLARITPFLISLRSTCIILSYPSYTFSRSFSTPVHPPRRRYEHSYQGAVGAAGAAGAVKGFPNKKQQFSRGASSSTGMTGFPWKLAPTPWIRLVGMTAETAFCEKHRMALKTKKIKRNNPCEIPVRRSYTVIQQIVTKRMFKKLT